MHAAIDVWHKRTRDSQTIGFLFIQSMCCNMEFHIIYEQFITMKQIERLWLIRLNFYSEFKNIVYTKDRKKADFVGYSRRIAEAL